VIPFLSGLVVCLVGWIVYKLWSYACATWVPVLCYHHVAETTADDPGGLFVSPQQFNDQLGHLRKSGYSPVSLNQLYDHVAGGLELPDNPVVVTFDDGYLDNWTWAFPMLQHYEVPATIFVISSLLEAGDQRPNLDDVQEGALTREMLQQEHRSAGGDRAYLNWCELSRMRASGLVAIAGHSHTHIDLSRVDRRTVLEELRVSRAMLMEKAGGECLDLAWPYGSHRGSAERAARIAGYRSAYRISTRLFGGRGNRPGANPLALRRLAVTPDLDLEKALEFFHQPTVAGRLRAVLDYVGYHIRKRRGRG